jgi:hypothetical protein
LQVINPGNQVQIIWDTPTDDAVLYSIYAAADPNSFNFDSPIGTTAAYSYLDADASTHTQRYYVVRAEDAAGNKESNINIVGKYDLDLDQGYNLIGLPLVPFTNDVSSIMHQNGGYHPITILKHFNNQLQAFESTVYNDGWSPGLSQMNYGEGYFVFTDNAITFTFVGTIPVSTDIVIKQGMNCISSASMESMEIEELIQQDPLDPDVVFVGKRTETGSYQISSYTDLGWVNTFPLNTGEGYWLKATKDITITVNS